KPPPRRKSVQQHIAKIAEFLVVVAQFGVIVLLVQYWQLENQLLARLMWLAFVGFVIHHLLPLRFRLPFFAMLSLFAVITAVGHFGPNVGVAWLTGTLTTARYLSSADSFYGARWAGGGRRRWAGFPAGAQSVVS